MLDMKFRYKKYGPYLRPVIPVKVKYNNHFIAYEVLVDSGADLCVFDAEIGDLLKVPYKESKRELVSGIAGQSAPYFIHQVEIEIGGWTHKVDAGFLQTVAGANSYGVVGQKGFFDIFVVKFDLIKEEIELKERRG